MANTADLTLDTPLSGMTITVHVTRGYRVRAWLLGWPLRAAAFVGGGRCRMVVGPD